MESTGGGVLAGDLVSFSVSELEKGFDGKDLEGLPRGVVVVGGAFELEGGGVFVLKHTQDALVVGALVESCGFAQDQCHGHGLDGSTDEANAMALGGLEGIERKL